MTARSLGTLAVIAALAVFAPSATAQPQAPAPSAAAPSQAADAIFAAFARHPLVGLGDQHNLAQAGAFYAALVRDPRFAADVRNLVVEFGSAANQATLDRYLAGEDVPYADLRKVWTDGVGWPPGEIGQMYPDLFATVRAVNAALPADRRIRVWLGEPPIDWTKVASQADLMPLMAQRDAYPAALIAREILAKGQRALVIYGGFHYFSEPPGPPSIGYLLKRDHPAAFYFAHIYGGYDIAACREALERHAGRTTAPTLFTIANSPIEAVLRDPACTRGPMRVPGSDAKMTPEARAASDAALAKSKLALSGALAHALIYLGPTQSLTRSPYLQDHYLDGAYRQEMERRQRLLPGGPPAAATALHMNTRSQQPYRRMSP